MILYNIYRKNKSVLREGIMGREVMREGKHYGEVSQVEKKLQKVKDQLRVQKSEAKRKAMRRRINELKIDLGWKLMDRREYEKGLLLYRSLPWGTYGEIKCNGIARALTEMGDYDEARRVLDVGLRRYPDSYPLWVAMGALCETVGDYFEALKCLDVALEYAFFDEDSAALYNKALVLMRIGCYEEAQEIIEELIERYPEDPKYLIQRGFLALKRGYPEEALRYYQEAMEIWKEDPNLNDGIEIYSGLCSVYMELGMKKEAMEVALEGLKRFPDEDPVLYHNVGVVFFEMGWRKEAIEVLKEGITKFPEDEEMRIFLKEIEDDLDDPDRGDKPPILGVLLLMALIHKRCKKK